MARILVIGDNADIRETVQEILALRGHDAIVAKDGDAGLRHFDSQGFNLVITDLFMPNKDGLETIGEIRGRFPMVPIIAISGSLTTGINVQPAYLKLAAIKWGVRVLPKPFDPEELLVLVNECLRGSTNTPVAPHIGDQHLAAMLDRPLPWLVHFIGLQPVSAFSLREALVEGQRIETTAHVLQRIRAAAGDITIDAEQIGRLWLLSGISR